MDITAVLFLSSGLFLGWSLGANDAANVFGTAVGTRMVRFGTAALICSVFVVLGAVISGAGAARTLGELGAVNALPGAFMAALAAALAVYGMTKLGLPVSTTQAIVGSIIGWNLFSGFPTDATTLSKIVATWVGCPLLAALLAAPLFKATIWCVHALKLHLLRLDAYTRAALLLTGAFGAYALGANNIANVMGVFVNANPFTSFTIAQEVGVTDVQQLFLLGALAIAVGVFTYSRRVMLTVGAELLPLSPVGAWVALLAHSVVLFVFASQGLEALLREADLPALPLVPVSSSQAIVGAVIGIGLLKGGRAVRWSVAGRIVLGWIATPVASCLICFVSLFFLQNVFDQKVYRNQAYVLSAPVLERLRSVGMDARSLGDLEGFTFISVGAFRQALRARATLSSKEARTVLASAQIDRIYVDPALYPELYRGSLTPPQIRAITKLGERRFEHLWQFSQALARQDAAWRPRLGDAQFNDRLETNLDLVARIFSAQETEDLPP